MVALLILQRPHAIWKHTVGWQYGTSVWGISKRALSSYNKVEFQKSEGYVLWIGVKPKLPWWSAQAERPAFETLKTQALGLTYCANPFILLCSCPFVSFYLILSHFTYNLKGRRAGQILMRLMPEFTYMILKPVFELCIHGINICIGPIWLAD